jgi:hypothetical protein
VCQDGDKVAPSACDDGPHGRGAGGQMRYRVTVGGGERETVWIAVAAGRRELDATLKSDPADQLQTKIDDRGVLALRSRLENEVLRCSKFQFQPILIRVDPD